MSLVLAENEKLLKEWEYASSGSKKQKKKKKYAKFIFSKKLSVTDKRVVSETSNYRRDTRQEIKIEDIASVSVNYRAVRKPKFLIGVAVGLAILVAGVVMLVQGGGDATTVALGLAAGGALVGFLFLLGFLKSKVPSIYLSIEKKGVEVPVWEMKSKGRVQKAKKLSKRAQKRALKKAKKEAKRARRVRVVVNPDMAFEIADEISALLIK